MIVNDIILPIYKVGDEVEYIGGQDEEGKKMFLLQYNISPPYIVTKIGIDKFRSTINDNLVLKHAIMINHSKEYVFVAWMFEKVNI